MNLARLSYLFPARRYPVAADRQRLQAVLTATCQAVKGHAVRNARLGYPAPLTSANNAVSIDEILVNLPALPNRAYGTHEVIAALRELTRENYIDNTDDQFEVIGLTDTLFRAIAEEWAYAVGIRPFRIDEMKIYAPDMAHAQLIYERRINRLNA